MVVGMRMTFTTMGHVDRSMMGFSRGMRLRSEMKGSDGGRGVSRAVGTMGGAMRGVSFGRAAGGTSRDGRMPVEGA